MSKPRLRQSFVHRLDGATRLSFKFEAVNVHLCARHELESHSADEDKIWPRPQATMGSEAGRLMHNAHAIAREIQALGERPFKESLQWFHQLCFRPQGSGNLVQVWRRGVNFWRKEYLSTLSS